MAVRKAFAVALVASLTLTPALAGPYDRPYAVVERGDASEVRKEMPVAITKIDGVSTRDPRKPDPVAPCNRYRVVAKYASKLGPDWEDAIDTP